MTEPGTAQLSCDPLLGWAGLDPVGRVVALGGGLASAGWLRIGEPLADQVSEPAWVRTQLSALADPAAAPDPGFERRCRLSLLAQQGRAAADCDTPVELRLRTSRAASGVLRIAAEFWRTGSAARMPALEVFSLGTALYAATVAPGTAHPVGVIRFALHPVALPRLSGLDDLKPWLAIALERLRVTAGRMEVDVIAARTGVRDLLVWVREGAACAALAEQWLSAVTASALIGPEQRLVVGPSVAWCVLPTDGRVLGHLLDALDLVFDPGQYRPGRPAVAVSSLARERDIDERREALTGTLVELVQSGRARLVAEPVVDAPTGLACGVYLRAEFRSLFAVADLLDYLPDIVDEDAAADALNIWMAQVIRSAAALVPNPLPGPLPDAPPDSQSNPPPPPLPRLLQIRIGPAQLGRIDSLSVLVQAARQASGAVPCLLLPEAAVHRNAYLVIDAAAELTALGATLGIDDYRGLLPAAQLARAGVRTLRLHRSLLRGLTERRFAQAHLAELLADARASGLGVVVGDLSDPGQVNVACAAGALNLGGPLFGRAQRVDPPGRLPAV